MTKDDLEAIQQVCKRATPGPWTIHTEDEGDVSGIHSSQSTHIVGDICETDSGAYGPNREDAEFIVVAREWMPKLLNMIENFYKRDSNWQPVEDRDIP